MLLAHAFSIHTHHTFEAWDRQLFTSLFNFHLHAGKCKIAGFIDFMTEQIGGVPPWERDAAAKPRRSS